MRASLTSLPPPSPLATPADMSAANNAPRNAPLTDLPQAQVDAIIRAKRKAREPKACYPCHARKVKCDRNLPCDGCVKRDHAELCSYERPSKRRVGDMGPAVGAGYMDGSAAAIPTAAAGGRMSGDPGTTLSDGSIRLKQEPGTGPGTATGMSMSSTTHPSPAVPAAAPPALWRRKKSRRIPKE